MARPTRAQARARRMARARERVVTDSLALLESDGTPPSVRLQALQLLGKALGEPAAAPADGGKLTPDRVLNLLAAYGNLPELRELSLYKVVATRSAEIKRILDEVSDGVFSRALQEKVVGGLELVRVQLRDFGPGPEPAPPAGTDTRIGSPSGPDPLPAKPNGADCAEPPER